MDHIRLSKAYISKFDQPSLLTVDPLIFTTPANPLPTDGSSCEACNYGVDIGVAEIARMMPFVKALKESRRIPASKPIHYKNAQPDPDSPGGAITRVTVHQGQCTMASRKAGFKCLLGQAADEKGVDRIEAMPQVCSMYPLTYAVGDGYDHCLTISDENPPSIGTMSAYQMARPNIEKLYGPELVAELDAISSKYRISATAVFHQVPFSW